ncbi:hypothetical protein KKF86_06445, partial [bacterium]|nr:hypothetical protein [bacterium]
PAFQPHCTLLGKTDVSLPRLKSAIINLMNNYKPIEIHPVDFGYSDYLWRTLYIELKEKQILTNWHEHICDLLSINYSKDFLPHISLMYDTVSLREKERISSKIQLQSVYKIQSIQIVDCDDKADDWKPVFEFQI